MKVVAGVEPAFASAYDDAVDAGIRAAAQAGKVHAVGSCGLGNAGEALPDGRLGSAVPSASARMHAFERQITIAREFGLPLIVQANGAHAQTREALEGEGFPLDCVLVRAFSGSDDDLRAWVQAGSYISFGGWSADDPTELARLVELVPTDRVLVESCAPQETIDQLAGLPARCDQVVFVADAMRSYVSAEQLASNAAAFYG